MPTAMYCVLGLLAVALVPTALPAGGLGWDWLGAIGLCAMSLMVAISWDSESPTRPPALQLHRNLAVVATVLASLHALGYLISDPVTIEYLMLTAPLYMLISIPAWILLTFLTASAFPRVRTRAFRSFATFRRWHLAMSVLALAGAAWHVIGTGFVISGGFRIVAFSLLVLGLPLAAYFQRRGAAPAPTTPPVESVPAALRHSWLVMLLCVLAATLHAGIRNA